MVVLMSAPYDRTVMTGNAGRATGRPVLMATLGAACISSSAILVTLAHVGAVTTAFFRCALALPVLLPLAMLERRRLGPRPFASRAVAMLAGVFLAVDLVLWNYAIGDVGAGVATVLGNLQVLFVAAFAWLVLRERPDRRFLAVMPAVLAGVVLVSGLLGGHASGARPVAGIAFGVATSAAYACFLLILRTTAGHAPHVAGQLADATVGATAGAVMLAPIAGGLQLDIGWSSLRWLLLLALVSQTVGWLLITAALPRLPAAISSLLLLLQPAAAMVLADIVLGERPTLTQVGGAVLVCLGVLVVARAPARTRTAHWWQRRDPPIGPASLVPASLVHASPVHASPEQIVRDVSPARTQ